MNAHLVNPLNEMCAARCLFGDRRLALIPVSCLGGHLFHPARGQIPKAESITPSSSSSRYLIEHSKSHLGRQGQATDGDGDGYLREVCWKRRVWNMDFDIT